MPTLPGDVEAILAGLSTLEPRLRERQLRQLADTDPDLLVVLTTRLNEVAAQQTWRPGANEVLLSQRAGSQIGAFTLVRPLGSGGMGEVWLAERQDGDFVQQVAIKLLLRSGSERQDLIQRFLVERRILSTLSHPYIARLVDGGATADGEPYYAMEYVQGEALNVYCRERLPSLDARIRLLLKICEALAYAQNHFVVHRDLKPANILVDMLGNPHVLDFGIAKVLDEGNPEITVIDARAWTPAYAAPEQMLGEPVSSATDVYSLGIILFQVLTGALPKARRSGNFGDVLLQLTDAGDRASTVARRGGTDFRLHWGEHVEPQRIARSLKGDLDWIVEIATQRDPKLRYRNAEAMAEDLRRFLDGRPLITRASGMYRFRKFLRRYWLAMAAALIAISSLGAGLGVALQQAGRANAEALRANGAAQRAAAAAESAEQTRDFVVSTFEKAGPLSNRQGRMLTAAELIDDALVRLDSELPANSLARAELRVVFATALAEMGRPLDALPSLNTALNELAEIVGARSLASAAALQQRALIHGMLADSAAMSQDAERAMTILAQLPGDHRAMQIQIRTSLGKVQSRLGNFGAALKIYQNNLSDRTALFGPADSRLAADYNNICIMLLYLDRYDGAIAAAEQGLKLLRSDPKSPLARQSWMLNGLGTALVQRGDLDAATAAFDESARIAAAHAGELSEPKAIALHGLALVDYERGDLEAAEKRWLALEAGNYQDGTGIAGARYYSYGRLLLEQGRNREAQRVLLETQQRLKLFRSNIDPYLIRANAALALVDFRLGNSEALQRLAEAVAQARASRVQLDEWADIFGFAAQAAQLRGDHQAAIALRAEALVIYRALLPPDSSRLRRLTASLVN